MNAAIDVPSDADTSVRALGGFHHVTVVVRDALAATRFYRDLLGLRLVKRTVNFDMPETYHLYFGDESGAPGSLITIFEWPDAPAGRIGWGGAEHLSLRVVNGAALAYWRGHLEREDVDVSDPFDDHGYPTLRFTDPDGLLLELSAPAGEDVPDGAPALFMPAMAIGAIQHVALLATNRDTALAYYRDLLGFAVIGEGPNAEHSQWTDLIFRVSDDAEDIRLIVTLVDRTELPRANGGPGQTHHVAFAVADDAQHRAWQERIGAVGVPTSEILDRQYFRSVYFHDPDSALLEIATDPPGFLVDEAPATLGTGLMLPPWLESERGRIEQVLTARG